jgi:hypothetical protein
MAETPEQIKQRLNLEGEGGTLHNPDEFWIWVPNDDASLADATVCTLRGAIFNADDSFNLDMLRRVRSYLNWLIDQQEELLQQRASEDNTRGNECGVATIALLNNYYSTRNHDIRASWEYPGYISVKVSRMRFLAFGHAEFGKWTMNSTEFEPQPARKVEGITIEPGTQDLATIQLPPTATYDPQYLARYIRHVISQLGY